MADPEVPEVEPSAVPATRNQLMAWRAGCEGRRLLPVVQRIASEHGVDLTQVPGTGRGGRVRKQDVLAFLESGAARPTRRPSRRCTSRARTGPDPAPAGDGGQLSRIRRQIGEHMKRSLDTAAHCTTWIEVDMGRVEAARGRLGVTALAFVARASSTRSVSTRL